MVKAGAAKKRAHHVICAAHPAWHRESMDGSAGFTERLPGRPQPNAQCFSRARFPSGAGRGKIFLGEPQVAS